MKKSLLPFILIIFFYSFSVFAQQQPYKPLRINGNMVLDGKLDEPAWNDAQVESDFMQTGPNPGAQPTEKTEVRIVYNNEYLYVGITCYDSDASALMALQLERDFTIGQEDGTAVIIDTYNDKITGFNFISNILNARWDAQIANDGADLNASYNTFWDVATQRDSLGYTTEYRIPFSSLRFETKPEIIMGFRIARLIKRKNELITFPKCNPATNVAWTNVSFAREMIFYNLKSTTPFYITPYIIANYSEVNALNASETGYEKNSEFLTQKNFVSNKPLDKLLSNIGVDAKYGLTKNLTLDLTVNTDFAQAEVDDRIINLSKYNVNLPEKRNFFLESANYLSFGFPSGNELFISRSIGNENGIIVPIIGGARMTGKVNGWRMGILDMQTKGIENDSIAPHNFFVFRTRKDIDSLGSFVGGIFANRLNTDTSSISNQSIGLDFVKRINQQLAVEGGIASTTENFNFKPVLKSSYFHAGIFQSANSGIIYNSTIDLIGKDVNPVMGYLDENNYGLASGNGGYKFKAKEKSKIEYVYAFADNSYRWKLESGNRETFATSLSPGLIFKNGAEIEFSIFEYTIDSLSFNWHLDEDNAISQGTYKMFTEFINITSPQNSKYSATLSASYGGFYGGQRLFVSPYIIYYINKHINTSITYEYNHIAFDTYLDEPTPTLFESNLIRLGITYIFSTKVSLKLYTQFDDLSNQISSNIRFRYNPHEGTDLYIVINQGLNSNRTRLDPNLPLINSQAVIIKFAKTFDI